MGALVVAGGTAGCRTVAASRQRCLAGDLSGCEAACRKGVTGEGGCFHAAEQYRARAGLDFDGSDWKKSGDLFRQACDGGYADGCLLAAQAIEAPYGAAAADMERQESQAVPKMIGDGEVRTREQRLGRACSLGSAAGCKRLGDVLIGKTSDGARAAYTTACRAGRAPLECEAARAHEVEVAETFRGTCTHRQADQCTLLGNLLFAIDPPRAMRLFASECELRGVAELAGGLGGFIRGRQRQAAKDGISPLVDSPRTVSLVGGSLVEAHATRVAGELALVEVERALARQREELTTCLATSTPDRDIKLTIQLVVDRTGDVWRASIGEGTRSGLDAGCVTRLLETLSFSEPRGGLVTVQMTLFRAATPVPPAAPSAQP